MSDVKYFSGQNKNNIKFYDIVDLMQCLQGCVFYHVFMCYCVILPKEYQDIKLLLGWIDPVLPAQLDVICDFEQVYTRGVAGSRWALANPA